MKSSYSMRIMKGKTRSSVEKSRGEIVEVHRSKGKNNFPGYLNKFKILYVLSLHKTSKNLTIDKIPYLVQQFFCVFFF